MSPPRLPLRLFLAATGLASVLSAGVGVQDESGGAAVPALSTPTLSIPRFADEVERPRIDGRLDDPAWESAARIAGLTQVVPVAGAAPSERTEVLLAFDETSIFVGLRCFDRDPDAIRATQARRDADLDPDDRVELVFDPFFDRRNGFWFQISPAGSIGDALITKNGSSFNKQWDTIWHGRSRITAEGWEAELRIPVQSINFDPSSTRWGFNVRRLIRRRNEEARWASPTPRIGFFSLANAGVLQGFSGLKQGLGLDVKPFVVADYQRADSSDTDLDAGLDLFYRISPATKLSLSVNTDFAETEVDERRVNLTRFPLFFPERRDFFLEDSGAFFFGPSSGRGGSRGGDVIPFFSRRIGIDGDGGEVPLLGAVKVTSQTDSYSLGVLDVQTDEAGDLDSQNLAAVRFSKFLFGQSDVGVIWTHGDPGGGARNDTYGADFNFRTDRFLGDRNLRFSTYFLKTDTDGISDNDSAFLLRSSYPNDQVDLSASYTLVEDDFDPALGFVRRRGIKKYEARFAYRPRLYSSIRRLGFTLRPELFEDTSNATQSVEIAVEPISVELESGDEFRLDFRHVREVLDEDFEITDQVTVPEDAFTFTRYGFEVETSERRPVSAEADFETGDFFGGTRNDYSVGLDWRVNARFTFGGEYELNDVQLPDGEFHVRVARTRFNFQFGPELAWTNFAQWDNQSDFLGLNSRLWWIPTPGTEFFLVFNQGWRTDFDDRFAPEQSQLTFKLGYTFRL